MHSGHALNQEIQGIFVSQHSISPPGYVSVQKSKAFLRPSMAFLPDSPLLPNQTIISLHKKSTDFSVR